MSHAPSCRLEPVACNSVYRTLFFGVRLFVLIHPTLNYVCRFPSFLPRPDDSKEQHLLGVSFRPFYYPSPYTLPL